MPITSVHALQYLQASPLLDKFYKEPRLRTAVSRQALIEFACWCCALKQGEGDLGNMYNAIVNKDFETARYWLDQNWQKLLVAEPEGVWIWEFWNEAFWYEKLIAWRNLLNEDCDWDRFIECVIDTACVDITVYSERLSTRQGAPNKDEAREMRIREQESVLYSYAKKHNIEA